MRRLTRMLVPLTAASLLLAAPVAAAAPLVTTDVVTDSFAFDCGGYDAVDAFTFTVRDKIFFDDEGTPIRVVGAFHWEGTLTNSASGFSIKDNASYAYDVDLTSGTVRTHGLFYSWNVPGQGIVTIDAGAVTFEPDGSVSFAAGPHDVLDGDAVALACAAVS